MMVAGDAAARDAYLAGEPFAREGVWVRHASHPFRIAPLPYQPLPTAGAVPERMTHVVTIAEDAPGGSDRRAAARGPHMERVSPMAADGTLAVGGAILDESSGRMVGSIAVTAHADDAAARAWMAEDPYVTGGVWRDVSLHGTRFAPLPYLPLPGAA